MNLRKILSDDEITQLALLPETGAGMALLKVAEAERKRIRSELEENAMISEEARRDFRFKIGELKALNLAAQTSRDARLMVEKQENKNGRSE